jgi:hypothetical protein
MIGISGPRKKVEAVATALTDPVDVTGMTGQRTVSTHAYVSDPLVQLISPGPVRITVNIEKVASNSTSTGTR